MRYVGENYSYTGLIFHIAKGSKYESVEGEWDNGNFFSIQRIKLVDKVK
ncbi:DUF7225 domain-containing protein [Litchfieldia alkalitelluris]